MFESLLNQRAQIVPASYARDKAGGSVATFLADPALALLPCAVQQDAGPRDDAGTQGKRRSVADASLFFGADPGVRANDQVRVMSPAGAVRIFTVVGPAFDRSGQSGGLLAAGVLWQLPAREFR